MFHKPTYVGVVMDMDDFKMNGKSAVSEVKRELCEFSKSLGLNSRIFLGGNENLPRTSGESVSQIASYEITKDMDPVRQKFKDCVYGIGSQDGVRKVVVVTNRFSQGRRHDYKSAIDINRMQSLDCDIHVFEFRRNSKELSDLVEGAGGTYHFMSDTSELKGFLDGILREQGYV